MTSE
jgi:NADPH-dependent curcumin reductase CurA